LFMPLLFSVTANVYIYSLSLHDALPISAIIIRIVCSIGRILIVRSVILVAVLAVVSIMIAIVIAVAIFTRLTFLAFWTLRTLWAFRALEIGNDTPAFCRFQVYMACIPIKLQIIFVAVFSSRLAFSDYPCCTVFAIFTFKIAP